MKNKRTSNRRDKHAKLSLFCVELILISVICWFQLVNCSTTTAESYTESNENNYYDNEDYDDSEELVASCSNHEHNKTCCRKNEFQCGNGECIPLDKVCSGNFSIFRFRYHWYNRDSSDCKDGTDEIGCSSLPCKSRITGCPQTCVDLPNNRSRCTCYKGYALKTRITNLSCEDVDECAIGVHSCSHDCVNLNGTFSCSCKTGFKTDGGISNSTCSVEDNANTIVLFQKESYILSFNLSSGESHAIIHSGEVDKMDYDPANEILYWSNSTSITRSYIPGAKNGSVTIGHAQAVGVPEFRDNIERTSIAIDWTAGNLYWLSSDTLNQSNSQIMVSKLDGRYVKTIIEIPKASSLVLDPEYGRMYWASGGDEPHIGTAWMNGMLRSIVTRLPNQNPIALTLDHLSNGRLYWADSINNTIYYIYKDGSRPSEVITTTPEQSPISLDIFENNLYWATKETNELLTIDKFGRGEMKEVITDLNNIKTFKVYHKLKIDKKIREGGLYCNKQCSHLCLHIPRGYSCTCPDGNRLVSLHGEIVCDNEQEAAEEDPLDCNCNDKDKVCNSSSPYKQCSCHVLCPDGETDYDYDNSLTSSQIYEGRYGAVGFIIMCLAGIFVITAIILSFYKRDNR